MHYIDLGGGMKITYWKTNDNLWHMKSDLTGEEYVSHEEFSKDIFFSTSKLNKWISNAKVC